MKFIHVSDLHFSNNDDKRAEVVRVTDFMLDHASFITPDAIVIAGDLADEYDGRIRVDSPCFNDMLSFVKRAASIAPVLIVLGTPSHDRNTPTIFRNIKASNQIFVASHPCRVWLAYGGWQEYIGDSLDFERNSIFTLFSCLPSPDKVAGVSLAETASNTRLSVDTILKEWGEDLPAVMRSPHVVVSHGMLDGVSLGSYVPANDQEFTVESFRLARPDYVALGHVHKSQEYLVMRADGEIDFPVVYSGSPGRLTFGETEPKGFHVVEFKDKVCRYHQVPTPARRFVFGDLPEWSGSGNVYNEALCLARDCKDADVRFRVSVPEDSRCEVDRDLLESVFDGARSVKIEINIIPTVRTRDTKISRSVLLPEKVEIWGASNGLSVGSPVLDLAGRIEGLSADELIAEVS